MTRKRFAVALFDLACCAVLALYFAVVCVTPAYAYVDPSVMTYAIQAFAGVAVALGAVAGVALRRTRKVLFKALNIDENARKEVEADVHRLDDDGNPIGLDDSSVAAPKKKRAKGATSLRWPARLAYAVIVSVFFVFTIFVVAPYEIVAANSVDLVFGLPSLWDVVVIPALLIVLVLALVLSCLRGKVFHAVLLIVFSLGLAAWVQALFLNSSLPAADGRTIVWEDYTTITVISSAVWVGIIALPLVLSHWFGSAVRGFAAALSVCLVIVQGVGVASLFVDPAPTAAPAQSAEGEEEFVDPVGEERQVTEEGLFEVAPENNVIVLVLDTTDIADFNEMLTVYPEVSEMLDGFTHFTNTTGSMIPTRYAIPYLLSGQLPVPEETIGEYLTYKYDRSTLLPDIAKAGYSIGLYSDALLLDPYFSPERVAIADSTMNVHPLEEVEKSASLNREGALAAMWKCALYRDMPWLFKSPFWFYTDEINNSMVHWNENSTGGGVPYTLNDFNYHKKLKSIGLSVVDDGSAGSFKFIHLAGSHVPYTMDENGEEVAEGESSLMQQMRGSFAIVDEYLSQLRELGVYDDATIIITADHGRWYLTEEVDAPTCPIMLVKPSADSPYAFEGPLRTSDVPASHLDFGATIIDAMGLDASSYGTPLFELTDAPRSRPYFGTLAVDEKEVGIVEYVIEGDALDFSAWKPTGNKWESG